MIQSCQCFSPLILILPGLGEVNHLNDAAYPLSLLCYINFGRRKSFLIRHNKDRYRPELKFLLSLVIIHSSLKEIRKEDEPQGVSFSLSNLYI